MNDLKRKKIGRPKVDSEAVNIRCEQGLLAEIDSWRSARDCLPSRQEAMRYFATKFLSEWDVSKEDEDPMTKSERQLLLMLAQFAVTDITKQLMEAGMTPDQGRGGATIRKISELVTQINTEAST
ncbi:hypothetical protein JK192_16360 [Gluconobacter cerinus]|uniref:hypothetical protein n=1 Tax=Gluconobacter cerinus TaxID=38307 RepID=UPI001B8CA7C1|nr:hypothetical protein [Gluconobacter cerinus]MBS1032924.1 hypothetical protein [Gluconobacter cerinus]